MSRCFPYTPRVCETKKAEERGALLEPIELQSKREKKDKSHRKKEKRRERKHKDKDILSNFASCSGAKSDIFEVEESNQLEKSDITFEQELPTLSENICYRSDGTQSSPKRKRTIVRIKSSLKHSDPGTSGSSPVDPEAVQSTQVHEEPKQPSAEADAQFDEATSTSYQHLSAAEIEHDSLIQNWAQPLRDSVLNDYGDDDDWLFDTKLQNSHGSKRFKATTEVVFGCTNQTLWSQAQWLPEPGLWALPLAVPF